VRKTRTRTRGPSWPESKKALGLAIAMIIFFLGYTLYMFSYFQFPGVSERRAPLSVYASTIGIVTLAIVGAVLLGRWLKKHCKNERNK
jgi:hypothetical protein